MNLLQNAFEPAWQEFTDQLKGEGTRIISMFKSIKPEVENDQTIKIHLSNAAQKDTFVQNYKQRLINFLENKFIFSEIDIETTLICLKQMIYYILMNRNTIIFLQSILF